MINSYTAMWIVTILGVLFGFIVGLWCGKSFERQRIIDNQHKYEMDYLRVKLIMQEIREEEKQNGNKKK